VKLPVPQQIMADGSAVSAAMRQWMTNVSQSAAVALNTIDNVLDYGAIADGATDCTAIFQRAIDTIAARGGGELRIPPGRYWFDGVLDLPRYVNLVGECVGPMSAHLTGLKDPEANTFAPIMLVTNTVTEFITSAGGNVSDLVFYYPEQIDPDSVSTPTTYPATILCGPAVVYRCYFSNSFIAVNIMSGRSRVQDCFIGALYRGVYVDYAYDTCVIDNCHFWVFYDCQLDNDMPNTFPSGIGTWALANGIAIDARRCDSLILSNLLILNYFVGIQLADSPDTQPTYQSGYGHGSNIDIDGVVYGIYCTSSNNAADGWKFTNVSIAEGHATGQYGIDMPAGGAEAPLVQIIGGHTRGTWAGANYRVSAGKLRLTDFLGVTDVGALTAPAVPASTVAATNTFPHDVRVHIYGGTTTVVAINGTTTGLISPCSIMLLPGETVTITYTVAPAWTWFSA